MEEESFEKNALKHALKNAIEHKGSANPKPVFSKLIKENPEIRKNAQNVLEKLDIIVTKINKLSLKEQRNELKKIDSSMLEKKQKIETSPKLELIKTEGIEIIMRFAPNPNSPLHLGNARQAILNDYLAKKYDGKLILRFDDTDPKNPKKKPNKKAYDLIRNDIKWLGVKVNQEVIASLRLDRYYEVLKKLLTKSKAYFCNCSSEDFSEKKKVGIDCPCRTRTIKNNLKIFKQILRKEHREGSYVARLKTDMTVKDPAQRDWPMMRIINKEHPQTGKKFIFWPLLDFHSAIDDHDFGITHILRGQDLASGSLRQKWLYKFLGWEYPLAINIGHLGIKGKGTFSKSEIKKLINEKKLTGWDDVSIPTLLSFKRRGFNPKAIYEFIISHGMGGSKANVSEEKLWNFNKQIIDGTSKRFHFVKNPKKFEINFNKTIKLPNHPKNDLGERTVKINNQIFLSEDDLDLFKENKTIRLLQIGNVNLVENKLVLSKDEEIKQKMPKIQWVSEGIDCEILTIDKKNVKGLIEKNITNEKEGTIIQLIRNFFCKIETKKPLTLIFTHD